MVLLSLGRKFGRTLFGHRALRVVLGLTICGLLVVTGSTQAQEKASQEKGTPEKPAQAETKTKAKTPDDAKDWKPLFDGKSLAGWKLTKFGGDGEVLVENGQLILEMGGPLTGITWTKDFPKQGFEISLDAQRVQGTDFFVGLTFPVRDSYASFIVGGWAGSVVGISSIDGHDASDNETTQVIKFDNGRWYNFRVRIEAERIQCWVDNERIINQNIKDRKISTRNEVDPSRPLGLATFETKAAIKNFKYRLLKAGE